MRRLASPKALILVLLAIAVLMDLAAREKEAKQPRIAKDVAVKEKQRQLHERAAERVRRAAEELTVSEAASSLGDWRKPWADVKGFAAAQCAETFDQFQLQAVCMENEREGYEKMQGHFGLPPDVAEKAKERCARIFKQFQLQAVCMENEREGYNKMKNY